MKDSLRAVSLNKSYGKKKVVDSVSIEVRRGEVVGLLGPNGAGKTTTFSMVLGLVPQDSGRIYLDDEDITGLPMYLRARKGLCLLPQEPSSFRKLTVEDNLLAIMETMPDAQPAEGRRSGQDLQGIRAGETRRRPRPTPCREGSARRLEIARAMITDPEFILLDEPFTGIDPLAILDLQEIVREPQGEGTGTPPDRPQRPGNA